MRELLSRNTERSALLLRRLLGQMRCHPVKVDIGKPYYSAKTSIETLYLIEECVEPGGTYIGSNSLRWWTRSHWSRTAGRVAFEVAILETEPPQLYQQIAPKATHLRQLGMSLSRIARKLGVDDKPVAKSIIWIKRNRTESS